MKKKGIITKMINEIKVDLPKVAFTSTEMIIKRKKNDFIIPLNNIKEIHYTKKSFLNYLLIYGLTVYPGWLQVNFKAKMGKRKNYSIKIKYKDLLKFPKQFYELIDIS